MLVSELVLVLLLVLLRVTCTAREYVSHAVARACCFFRVACRYSLTLTRLAGEATPSLRSQSEPEGRDASDGDVRVLVGSTYEQTVLRAARTHHTVVMLYVPWCSRSKRLAPEWLALAQRYKRDGGLLVAKLDARRRVQ